MKQLIKAEWRRSWKGRRILVATLCFLCYFASVYGICLAHQKAYTDDLIMQLHEERILFQTMWGIVAEEQKDIGYGEETKQQLEEKTNWDELIIAVQSWAYERQAPEYFGWKTIAQYPLHRANRLAFLFSHGYEKGRLKAYGINQRSAQRDQAYWQYFLDHNIAPYESPYEPNLLNFILQLFQKDTMLLLLVVVTLLMMDQLCHEFDSGAYKTIYSLPIKRSHLLIAKIITAMGVVLTAFVLGLLLFAIVPLSQYGVGSSQYPYIVHTYDIMLWKELIQGLVPLVLVVSIFFMLLSAVIAMLFRQMTNAILSMGTLFVVLFFLQRSIPIQTNWFTLCPCFYIQPIEICTHEFGLSQLWCILITLLWCILLFLLYIRLMKHRDLA